MQTAKTPAKDRWSQNAIGSIVALTFIVLAFLLRFSGTSGNDA